MTGQFSLISALSTHLGLILAQYLQHALRHGVGVDDRRDVLCAPQLEEDEQARPVVVPVEGRDADLREASYASSVFSRFYAILSGFLSGVRISTVTPPLTLIVHLILYSRSTLQSHRILAKAEFALMEIRFVI